MSRRHDLVVVGAGPAGLAAATTAAELGLDVLLADEHPVPGGQIWRRAEDPAVDADTVLGPEYVAGGLKVARFRASGAGYLPGATVWGVEPGRVLLSVHGEARDLEAGHVILATGAIERPFPVPGWTLPGVMGAGGAQALLKSAGLVPAEPPVLAGTGPLLLLLAWQYLQAGVVPRAILDTTPRQRLLGALPHLRAAHSAGGYLAKGLALTRGIRRAGIPVARGVDGLRALGEETLEAIEYRHAGRWHRLRTRVALLHQGVVPNVNLAMAAGVPHRWDPSQLCWRPVTDGFGVTPLEGLAVAGDGAGIGGAESAEWAGELAALEAARLLGRIGVAERDRRADAPRRALERSLRVRPFLETLYRPRHAFRVPAEAATLVCRCEEVSAGTLRAELARGAADPNRLKSRTRCGMGPCQGRYCGLTVTELAAEVRGITPGEVGCFRIRPPVKPVDLTDLLALEASEPPPEERLSGGAWAVAPGS